MKMLALGYWTIVIFAVFNAVGAASDDVKKVGEKVSFRPTNIDLPVSSIIWKQRSSSGTVVKAIEWDDDGFNIPNQRFKNITTLDEKTGQITITNLAVEHSGVYTIDINSKEREQRFSLKVFSLVPKPVIKKEEIKVNPNAMYLMCEYNETIIWKNSAGEILKGTPNDRSQTGEFITVEKKGNPDNYYTCTLKNAVSEKTSDPVYEKDLFKDSGRWWIALIVLFVAFFLVILFVLLYKFCSQFHDLFENLKDVTCIGAILKFLDGEKKNAQPEQEAVYVNGEENKRTGDGTDEMLMAKTTEKTPDSAES